MKYWIKLWVEILNDPKMGTLDDRLWRRAIELALVAGETRLEGVLPPIEDICRRLGLQESEFEHDFTELVRRGIVASGRFWLGPENKCSTWFLMHFTSDWIEKRWYIPDWRLRFDPGLTSAEWETLRQNVLVRDHYTCPYCSGSLRLLIM